MDFSSLKILLLGLKRNQQLTLNCMFNKREQMLLTKIYLTLVMAVLVFQKSNMVLGEEE
jgi:hypothetical protein